MTTPSFMKYNDFVVEPVEIGDVDETFFGDDSDNESEVQHISIPQYLPKKLKRGSIVSIKTPNNSRRGSAVSIKTPNNSRRGSAVSINEPDNIGIKWPESSESDFDYYTVVIEPPTKQIEKSSEPSIREQVKLADSNTAGETGYWDDQKCKNGRSKLTGKCFTRKCAFDRAVDTEICIKAPTAISKSSKQSPKHAASPNISISRDAWNDPTCKNGRSRLSGKCFTRQCAHHRDPVTELCIRAPKKEPKQKLVPSVVVQESEDGIDSISDQLVSDAISSAISELQKRKVKIAYSGDAWNDPNCKNGRSRVTGKCFTRQCAHLRDQVTELCVRAPTIKKAKHSASALESVVVKSKKEKICKNGRSKISGKCYASQCAHHRDQVTDLCVRVPRVKDAVRATSSALESVVVKSKKEKICKNGRSRLTKKCFTRQCAHHRDPVTELCVRAADAIREQTDSSSDSSQTIIVKSSTRKSCKNDKSSGNVTKLCVAKPKRFVGIKSDLSTEFVTESDDEDNY